MTATTRRLALAAFAIGSAIASSGFAATLLNFVPEPVSGGLPEFVYTPGFQLTTGVGTVGNGDGNIPVAAQAPGGLTISTPLTVPGIIPGKVNNGGGTTTFYDVTLQLTGLFRSANANDDGEVVSQKLGAGTFTFLSTDPDGPGGNPPIVLLTGNISTARIGGFTGGTEGSVLSSTVTYTGGAIFNQLVAQGGATTGGFSWSLIDISDTFPVLNNGLGVTLNTDTGQTNLNPFGSNATGLFSSPRIPEPASVGLLALSALGFGIRRARKA